MDIWEKLKENPEDFRLSKGDEFQDRLGQIRWKNSPEAARGLARFAKNGDGHELAKLFYECRGELEDNFEGIGRHRPLNAYVLAKLISLESGEEFLWLGSEYLRKGSVLRDAGGEKATACFQKAVQAGRWEPVMEIGFSLIREGRVLQGVRILELLPRECRDMDSQSAKKICRTLGAVCLNGKLQPPDPYRGEKWLKYSVEKYEDENAAYTLGMIYREGRLLHMDREASLKYLTYAAERGHSEAGLFLVRGFLEGDPVFGKLNLDVSQVIPYLSSAAGNLNPQAIYYAGVLNCLCGDFDTAAQYMENVKPERDEAYGILGQIYCLQKKYEKAWPNLKTACEEKGLRSTIEPLTLTGLGNTEALASFPGLSECMGRFCHLGLGGCPVDDGKAAYYYEEAVRLGYAGSSAYHFLAERLLTQSYAPDDWMNPARKKEILEAKRKGLFYWEEAVSRSGAQYFPPPRGMGDALSLFEQRADENDRELNLLVQRCVGRLEEYAYRTRQYYSGQEAEGRVLYEYAHYIYSRAKIQKSTAIRNKLGDEIAGYLDLAVEAGIPEACYDRARIYYWHGNLDKAHELCEKGAKRGDKASRTMLGHFKKKAFGGYVYKI